MNFDLGVWSANSKVAANKAGYIYERLCRGERPAELQRDVKIDDFYQELTSHWPEIDPRRAKYGIEKDPSPWGSVLDRSDVHVLISAVWSRAEEVYTLVQQLAEKHSLVLYDPQSDEVHLPEQGNDILS